SVNDQSNSLQAYTVSTFNPSTSKVLLDVEPQGPGSAHLILRQNGVQVADLSVAGSGGGVTSIFGRSGTVTAQSGDYSVAQITGAAPLSSPTFSGLVTMP